MSESSPHRGRRRQLEKPRRRTLRENVEGYAFVGPAVIIIALFGIFPIFFTVYVSVFQWRIKRGPFVGLHNYREIFGSPLYVLLVVAGVALLFLGPRILRSAARIRDGAAGGDGVSRAVGWLLALCGVGVLVYGVAQIYAVGDRDMVDSLRVTVWYSFGTVPVQLALGLIVAVLLDRRFRGRQSFRVMFLLPYIVPSVASAAVFERIFSLRPEALANQIVGVFGGKPLQWLYEPTGVLHLLFGFGPGPGDTFGMSAVATGAPALVAYLRTWAQGPSLALFSVMMFNYWVFVGYYALIYLNGLSQIPPQLYDAAEVDGASRFMIFRKIVLPLVSPSTYFLSLIGIIGTFKAFNHIYVLRTPAAQGTIDPMSIYIFFTFFRKSRFGYAAALSLLLFAIVLILTLIQRRIMERRVFYGE